jgi:hypothetical protein
MLNKEPQHDERRYSAVQSFLLNTDGQHQGGEKVF